MCQKKNRVTTWITNEYKKERDAMRIDSKIGVVNEYDKMMVSLFGRFNELRCEIVRGRVTGDY